MDKTKAKRITLYTVTDIMDSENLSRSQVNYAILTLGLKAKDAATSSDRGPSSVRGYTKEDLVRIRQYRKELAKART